MLLSTRLILAPKTSPADDSPPALHLNNRRDDLIPAPMTVEFPFDSSYFGAKVRQMILRPLFVSTVG